MLKEKKKINSKANSASLSRTYIFTILFCLISSLGVTPLHAANNQAASDKKPLKEQKETMPTAPPRTLYIDSQTGYTIYPEKIEIRDSATHKIIYEESFTKDEAIKKFKDGVVPSSFLSSLPVAPGPYECTVKTTNYKPRTFFCKVDDKVSLKTLRISPQTSIQKTTVNIDPIEKPLETRTDYLMSLEREDAAVFTGFIVDDDTGLPLAGVRVSSKDSSASTVSNERGYFILPIPVPSFIVETGNPIPDDIFFEKDGHQTEVRRYEVIWKNEVSRTRVRLIQGKGEIIIDTRKHRRHFKFPDR